jgi:hypothetical protein
MTPEPAPSRQGPDPEAADLLFGFVQAAGMARKEQDMPRFRIEAEVVLEPQRFKGIDDPSGAVRDDADAALHTFADAVGFLIVNKVAD